MSAAVADIDVALENSSAERILAWAASTLPRVGFATGFGAEGCVLVDMIARLRLPIDIFTLDTGLFFDETYALWRKLEARYGVTIRAVRPELTVDEQAAIHGGELWTRDPYACCALRKVEPLRRALVGLDGWVSALRRDQSPERAAAAVVEQDRRHGLYKINPLAAWTADDVAAYVRANQVPTNPLHQAGYPSIGCRPCTTPVSDGEDPRAGRWRGRAKTECGIHLRKPGES